MNALTVKAMSQGTAAQPISFSVAFHRAMCFEWRHLTALRSTWVLVGIIGVLSVVGGLTLTFDTRGGGTPVTASVASALQWDAVLMQLPLIALLLLPIGTGPVTTELARGAARTTWLTAGSRGIAFGAKLGVGAAVTAGLAAASVLVIGLIGAVAFFMTGTAQPDWAATAPAVLNYLLFMVCWPILGASTAALLRNRVGTALALVLWPLVGERIAGMLLGQFPGLDGISNWLPFAAARAGMAYTDGLSQQDGDFIGALAGSNLSSGAGMAVFLVFTALVAAAGSYAYARRDAP